jgi:hypothetical protein
MPAQRTLCGALNKFDHPTWLPGMPNYGPAHKKAARREARRLIGDNFN